MNSLIAFFASAPHRKLDNVAKMFLVCSVFFTPFGNAPAYIFMGLTLVFWLAAGGYGERWNAIRTSYFAWSIVILYALLLVGALYSFADPSDIKQELGKYARLLFGILAISLLQERVWRERGINAFALAMFITLAISLVSLAVPIPFMDGASGKMGGSHHVFKDKILHNLMMSFFVLVMLVKYKQTTDQRLRVAYLLIALCAAINIIFFVHGRIGYLSLAVVLVIFINFYGSAGRRWKWGGAIVLAFVAAFYVSDSFKERIELVISEARTYDSTNVTSVGARIAMARISLDLIGERPIFGWGTGAYGEEFCSRADSDKLCKVGGYHPHNQFLAFGVQLGVIGILAYVLLLISAIRHAWLLDTPQKVLGLGLIGALLVDSLFHGPLFLVGEAQFFILMLAVLLAARHSEKRKNLPLSA